jgi:hypothetical protein
VSVSVSLLRYIFFNDNCFKPHTHSLPAHQVSRFDFAFSRIMILFLILSILFSFVVGEPAISQPGDWVTVPQIGLVDANNQQPWLNRRAVEGLEGIDPLAQHVPTRYNRHPETVPVLRSAKGSCDCPEAHCPTLRMTSDVVQSCERTHALACWKRNPACAKPVLDSVSCSSRIVHVC